MIYLNFKTKFNRNKLACFDFDYTLIKTKSGKKFPIDKNDWVWLYDNIPNKITQHFLNVRTPPGTARKRVTTCTCYLSSRVP